MGGDLVKSGDQSLVRVSPSRRAMTEALTRLRQNGGLERHNAQPLVSYEPSRASGEIIDLPRVCSVHDRPYVARYLRDSNGLFRYAQTIRMTERLCEQYAAHVNERFTLPSGDLHEETCPWCGASGFGSVLCGRCHVEVCYGRTDARKHFHCRESCGAEGVLAFRERVMRGLLPSMRPDSAPSSGSR
jgi:hypothetical protein